MEQWERELKVSRLIAGKTKCKINGTVYWVGKPSRESRYSAEQIYAEVIQESRLEGLPSHDEVVEVLIQKRIWTNNDLEQLTLITEKLDELKVGLYENRENGGAVDQIRKAIIKGRNEVVRLEGVRHSLDHITDEYCASSAKIRYLTGSSICSADFSPYWKNPDIDWLASDVIIDKVMDQLVDARLDETELRDLARTDPWRSIWALRKSSGLPLLDAVCADLNDEQRHLIFWTSMYESIKEREDAPDESVFDDDDMFDGWLVLQRRKRDRESNVKSADRLLTNPKIRNADEVFLFNQPGKTLPKMDDLNSAGAKQTKAQRAAMLKRMGEVEEQHMPDSALKIRIQAGAG
jgi:hypothetical protein